jgi:hypothetical protein
MGGSFPSANAIQENKKKKDLSVIMTSKIIAGLIILNRTHRLLSHIAELSHIAVKYILLIFFI